MAAFPRLCLLACCCSLLNGPTGRAAEAPTKADLGQAGEMAFLQLPAVPADCVVRVFKVGPQAFSGAPREQVDWAPYLESQGLDFSGGAFACYFAASGVVVIANTQDQLDLLTQSMCCP